MCPRQLIIILVYFTGTNSVDGRYTSDTPVLTSVQRLCLFTVIRISFTTTIGKCLYSTRYWTGWDEETVSTTQAYASEIHTYWLLVITLVCLNILRLLPTTSMYVYLVRIHTYIIYMYIYIYI